MQVSDFEKKRALNLIWNAAEDYEADPGFRVYDAEGKADLYWNCIIGAIWKHCRSFLDIRFLIPRASLPTLNLSP